jgi:hypothetical protein
LYLTSLPKAEGKGRVSSGGSLYPVWRREGKELFYTDLNDEYYAVPATVSGNEVIIGEPQHLLMRQAVIVATLAPTGLLIEADTQGRLCHHLVREEGIGGMNSGAHQPLVTTPHS